MFRALDPEETRMRTRTLVPLAVLALAAGCGPCGYNRIVQEEQGAEKAWSDIETQLQRRGDLIPNLVEVVKGYATHEEQVFSNVANARAAMMGASSRADKINASNALDSAIGRLFSITESYPQLQANQNFRTLMDQLEGTENRLAVARKRYNDAVQEYNTDVRGIPGSWWARIGGFPAQKDYFKADAAARSAPQVKFTK
jgi:LemA protein